LRRVYADAPFLEARKKAPSYLKFLRELLFKKDKTGDASIAPIGEAYNNILQSRSSAKLQDPDNFSIRGYADGEIPL